MIPKRTGILLLILMALPAMVAAAGRPLEYDDLLRARRITDPVISPDGRWVAYAEGTYELDSLEWRSDIYMVLIHGGEPQKLTSGRGNNTSPMFTPDGKHLVFASTRDGSRQFYSLPLSTGGEASRLTDHPGGVSGGVLSPDGRYLLYHSRTLVDSSAVVRENGPGSPVRARIIDNLLFRHWDHWRNGRYSHLFCLRLKSDEEPVDLIPGKVDCPPISLGSSRDYAVRPDEGRVYYVANRDRMVAISTNNDIWSVSPDGGGMEKLTSNPANDNLVAFDPTGRYLAYRAMERPGFESDQYNLILRDMKTGGSANLTEEFDRSVGEVVWSPDGRFIYFTAGDEGRESIFRVNTGMGERRQVTRLTDTKSYHSISVTPDGGGIVALRESFTEPAEIVVLPADGGGEERALTSRNREWLSGVDMNGEESFRFAAEDGVEVHGYLIRPPGFDSSKKYPLVYLIHGGPQGAWTTDWHYRWNAQMWASWGYVIVMVNPRGSTTYGQQFTDQITGDWGGKCYRDLMRGLDYVLENYSFIDPDRVGAAGASFGGYMVNWINGHTDRFRTLVCHAGVFNHESMYASTEELWFPEWEFGGMPWDNPTLYREWSPHRYAKNFSTPQLVIHGALDFRVPLEQGLMAFTTLQRQGIDSRLLYFPDEGHWIADPRNGRLWHETIRQWLDKYLK